MADKQFVNGIRAFKPNDNAPEFVIANLVMNASELKSFLDSQTRDEIKVDLKRSQKGTYYLEVNNWQRQQTAAPVSNTTNNNDNDDDSNLPF